MIKTPNQILFLLFLFIYFTPIQNLASFDEDLKQLSTYREEGLADTNRKTRHTHNKNYNIHFEKNG